MEDFKKGALQPSWQRSKPPWLLAMLKRKLAKLVAVALPNKIARIAWNMMATGETYRKSVELPELACTA